MSKRIPESLDDTGGAESAVAILRINRRARLLKAVYENRVTPGVFKRNPLKVGSFSREDAEELETLMQGSPDFRRQVEIAMGSKYNQPRTTADFHNGGKKSKGRKGSRKQKES